MRKILATNVRKRELLMRILPSLRGICGSGRVRRSFWVGIGSDDRVDSVADLPGSWGGQVEWGRWCCLGTCCCFDRGRPDLALDIRLRHGRERVLWSRGGEGSNGAAIRAVWRSLWLERRPVEWQSLDHVAMMGRERVLNVALVP